ncbi:hypothetical protein RAD15_43825, partial [Bradyrhizobium sp. 14AA]
MAPPAQGRLLWEHWDRPRSYYFPGNHLFHFDRGAHLRSMAHFLAHVGVVERRRERGEPGTSAVADGLPASDAVVGYPLLASGV